MSRTTDQLLAMVAVVQSSISVMALGRRHTARDVRRRGADVPATSAELAASGVDAWRSCRAISRAAVIVPWRVRCLPASFALHRLLRRQGVSSAVCVGVLTVDGELIAHAWVECGDLRLDPLAVKEPYVPLPLADATVNNAKGSCA